MPDLILATTEKIAGHRIVRTLGYVQGSHSSGESNVAVLRRPPHTAIEELTERARELGANAVVGLRWVGASAYFAYGTAVVIEPKAQ